MLPGHRRERRSITPSASFVGLYVTMTTASATGSFTYALLAIAIITPPEWLSCSPRGVGRSGWTGACHDHRTDHRRPSARHHGQLPVRHASFAAAHDAGDAIHEGSAGTEIDLPVAAEDVVVLKRRASAFAGTDLDLVLRARGIDTLAIAGVATSTMVAATCYDAADRGYQVTVLRDGCADGDPAMHNFFMDTVVPSRGFEVAPCAGWHGGNA